MSINQDDMLIVIACLAERIRQLESESRASERLLKMKEEYIKGLVQKIKDLEDDEDTNLPVLGK